VTLPFSTDSPPRSPPLHVVVVTVDNRLAPKHPVPTSYEDSHVALRWALVASDPWLTAHGDLSRVFLAKDHAGVRHATAGGGIKLIHP
jgi:acetyl esterase/lipase